MTKTATVQVAPAKRETMRPQLPIHRAKDLQEVLNALSSVWWVVDTILRPRLGQNVVLAQTSRTFSLGCRLSCGDDGAGRYGHVCSQSGEASLPYVCNPARFLARRRAGCRGIDIGGLAPGARRTGTPGRPVGRQLVRQGQGMYPALHGRRPASHGHF